MAEFQQFSKPLYIPSLGCQIKDLDIIYERYLGLKVDGFFVDVGAFDCDGWSNTSCLADIGWSGIVIEPQPTMANACRSKYANNDKVVIVEMAASDITSSTKLYPGGSQSTIIEEMIEVYASTEQLKFSGMEPNNFIWVDTDTLDSILDQHGAPTWPSSTVDVMSIDVEGAELLVLQGFTISWWMPKLVIIEMYEDRPDEPQLSRNVEEINAYMKDNGYLKIYSDYINNIYALAR